MKPIASVALIAVAVLAGAGRAEDLDYYREHYPSSDLSEHRPVELLQALEVNAQVWKQLTILRPFKGWVREEDLPALISKLDSEAACTPVVLAISSFSPRTSTVGSEAGFMIQGFREGEYPPSMVALPLTKESKGEILTWWKERRPPYR